MIYENSKYRESISRIAFELPIKEGSFLITGATGLIGSCMIDVFAWANQNLNCCFRIYALGRSGEKLNKRFAYCKDVVPVVQSIEEPLEIGGVNYILHAASNADPRTYAQMPAETILTNVIGARNTLECAKNNHARILLTSTFEVYGKLDQDVYAEDDYGLIDENQIRSCYPESKRTSEILFRAYHDEYGVDSVIARLASIYGPTMLANDSKAHAQFLRNAINGENIVLKSKGEQKRTYCYVMDAVSGLLKVLFSGKSCEAYNVANDASIATIAELASCVAELAETKVVFDLPDEIESKGFSKPQNCVLETTKIKALGWQGKFSLKQGLKETMDILKNG